MSIETFTLNKVGPAFTLDTPEEPWILLRGEGYSPVQSLVTAAAACAGYVYISVLNNSNVPHEIEKVTVSYTRDMAKNQSDSVNPRDNLCGDFGRIPRESTTLCQIDFTELSGHPVARP